MFRVAFNLDGCSKDEAEKWGELIVDACRMDPKTAITLNEVTEIAEPDPMVE